ncbi:SDR family NAD(P)-dependent oxidoreductase [Castellaniella sp.]|uniref:SDR family NAD(P)-dependent oxidoreductase n=1 Tax=Castellaniella sp. TaxID=1955812 RepID=UPI0035679822
MSKTAIVTGASRGIGRACALRLAGAGFQVYLVAEGTQEELAAVAAECARLHPQQKSAHYGLHDLADPASAPAIAQAARDEFGRIDVLVNNAGVRIRKPFGEFSATDFDKVFAINLRAAFLLSQAVLPAMRAQGGGRIIQMASQLGLVADPGASVYAMTKAALIQLTRNMALELAPEKIIVNAVSPGPIITNYYKARLEREPALLQQRLGSLPAGRLGEESEVADVVAFLATTDATFMLGHNLVIDGGFVIH